MHTPTPARHAGPADPAGPVRALRDEQVIAVVDVAKRYDDVVAVDGISLAATAGTVLGVIGPSGAGKTTMIRMICGATIPDSGSVRVLGEDPRHFRRRTRESIGYMPQLFILYPDLTAQENVAFIAALFGVVPWEVGDRVRAVLELVDLWDARGRQAAHLSGGMQRRLELACALVHQPTLLILDEPTAGIDPLLRTRVWQEIDRLRNDGSTILVTTQYVAEAEYCDSVALVSDGKLVAHAPPEDLRRSALGGEVLEIGTADPIDASHLMPIPGVSDISQTGPRSLLVVAEDAGLANPRVIDAVEGAGTAVRFSREYRPTFDEVFATLVTRTSAQSQAPAAEGPQIV